MAWTKNMQIFEERIEQHNIVKKTPSFPEELAYLQQCNFNTNPALQLRTQLKSNWQTQPPEQVMANSKKYENFAARPLGNTVVVDWHNQPRDQRGTPGGEGFLSPNFLNYVQNCQTISNTFFQRALGASPHLLPRWLRAWTQPKGPWCHF